MIPENLKRLYQVLLTDPNARVRLIETLKLNNRKPAIVIQIEYDFTYDGNYSLSTVSDFWWEF